MVDLALAATAVEPVLLTALLVAVVHQGRTLAALAESFARHCCDTHSHGG